MTEAVRSYLLSIIAAALLLSVVQALLPKGPVKQIATLSGSLLVLLAVLSPIARLDHEAIAKAFAKIQLQSESAETGITVQNRQLMAVIIKDRCRTYILDKALDMGLSLEAEITLDDGTSYPYPTHVTIQGAASAAQKETLKEWIEENLGIPMEQQEWT